MLRHLLLGRKVMTNLNSTFKSRDVTLPTMVSVVKAMVFPVVMFGCYSWTIKKAEGWRIDAFELWCWEKKNSWESLAGKEIKPVNPEGNQFWIYITRIDVEAETPLDVKNRLIGKDPEAGKDWRQEEKGTTEDEMRWDEMVWWHHRENGHEFEQLKLHQKMVRDRGA